jgi:hypothetical protein
VEPSHELDPQRVCTLVLARLLPDGKHGLKRTEVVRSVAALLPGVGAAAAVERAWKLALEQGWIEESGRLTSVGRRELSQRVSVDPLPITRSWLAVQRVLLGRLALGMPPATGKSDFAADVVRATHSLSATTLTAAVDQLAWRALGVETDEKFTALAVQRYLFRERVPNEAKLDPRKFRQKLAASALQVDASDNERLRGAALRRWAAGMKLAGNQPGTEESRGLRVPDNDQVSRGETSLERFAAAVVDTARKPGVTRFHDDRAFIGSIWENMRGREPVNDMPLDAFKRMLVEAHRGKLLRMSRADLVQAMDPAEVARSEARYLSATFHFVALQAGGAR